jgi:FKBP-type peptidyl-prolyl cis-trans isomerase 2
MRRVLLLAVVLSLLLIGCLGEDAPVKPSDTTGPGQTPKEGNPVEGDVASINYIMKVEGIVVDTTYEEIARESHNSRLIFPVHPFGFEPLAFIIGSGHINPELNTALKDMNIGDKKTIVLPPEKSIHGTRRESYVQVIPRFSLVPLEEAIPTNLIELTFEVEPEEGRVVSYQYWNSTIIATNDDLTTLRHNPIPGSNYEFPGGNVTINLNNSFITMEFIPLINVTFIEMSAPEGYVTILSSNETHMVVDYNNHLAGKTLEIEIVLEEISKPITWFSNLDDALTLSDQTGQPVFILFTNSSCVTCRRIELEILTHPFALAIKDSFIWVKIDTEIQKDVADHLGIAELPVILMLKEREETSMITNFLPVEALRAEMEFVLAPE